MSACTLDMRKYLFRRKMCRQPRCSSRLARVQHSAGECSTLPLLHHVYHPGSQFKISPGPVYCARHGTRSRRMDGLTRQLSNISLLPAGPANSICVVLCRAVLSCATAAHSTFMCDLLAKNLMEEEAGVTCDICMESVCTEAMHHIGGCFHEYCKDCLEHHVLAHMESKPLPVFCPGLQCGNIITVDECATLLHSKAAIDRLDQVSQICLLDNIMHMPLGVMHPE